MGFTLKHLSGIVDGKIIGNPDLVISGVSGIREAKEGDITFVANPKYLPELKSTRASAVIISKEIEGSDITQLLVDRPYYAFARIMNHLYQKVPSPKGVSSNAFICEGVRLGKDVSIYPLVYIGEDAEIGDNTIIYPGCYIGERAKIGEQTMIYPNVTIREDVSIGKSVIIHSGSVIGSDGFGYATHEGRHYKIPQIGTVSIEDDVEIGANVTVDRAAMGKTVIKRGTKIDNLVQVAHNVVVGENCLLAAQAGIAGSAELGDHVTLAGQVGVVGHIKIGENVMAGAQSGISKGIKPGQIVSGSPAIPHREWLKAQSTFPDLPEMRRRIRELEDKVEGIDKRLTERGDGHGKGK